MTRARQMEQTHRTREGRGVRLCEFLNSRHASGRVEPKLTLGKLDNATILALNQVMQHGCRETEGPMTVFALFSSKKSKHQ